MSKKVDKSEIVLYFMKRPNVRSYLQSLFCLHRNILLENDPMRACVRACVGEAGVCVAGTGGEVVSFTTS